MGSAARTLRPVPNEQPRAVLYLRQSAYREESVSLELQETTARDYCSRMGYTVADVIRDPGVSGLKWDKRKGIQEVLRRVAEGEFDRVVVWRWSRLSRKRLHQAVAIDTLERDGVTVESATEPFDTSTAGGEFGREVLLAAASYESRQKGEQWVEAHERRRQLGLPSAGRPRFGYVWHRGDRDTAEQYVPDPDLVDTVRWMVEQYLDGHGFNAIANELNAHSIPNAVGRAWNPKGVRTYLDSGFAAGLIARSESNRSTDGHFRSHRWLDGAHEPIVDPELWQRYVDARNDRSRKAGWSTRPTNPLTGLVECDDCKGSMNRCGTRGYYYFICTRHARTGEGKACNVPEHRLHEVVFGWLSDLADEVGEAAEHARTAERAQLRSKTDAELAARELADVDRQLSNLTKQLVAGRVPESAYESARDDLMGQRGQIEERLAVAERAARQQHEPAPAIARGLVDEWDTLPVHDCRQLLSTLVRALVVTPPSQPRQPAGVRVDPAWGSC